ncbi:MULTISPECIES: site-specific integrase [Thiomonas]|uniref:Integrase n=4 Tax=Thiomonas TaxID=32012 RepID=D6CNZ0_THIA3|nr:MULTISPECIES: site-specific integrase [Thiomonas]CAZ90268.1 putative integrase [Thiomonas arsenitoxydans]CQR35644.1 putative integrase [Thiomonas arsenitoxydans]SBP87824.1 putative integrase [Thiomonas delicata]
MATLENRSRFRVTVRNREDLTREFPFNAPARVASHMAELRAQGFKPAVTQLEDTILVRVRQKGRAPQTFTLPSVETAEKLIRKIEEERGRGLYVDYARSHKVTVAQLMVRYLKEKVPKLKSADMLTYKLEAMLMDSGPHGKALVEEFKDWQKAHGRRVHPGSFQMRTTYGSLEWLHKPLPEVTTDDLNDFIEERLQDSEPATVDREVDIFSALFTFILDVWKYPLADSPIRGVQRPRYRNERNRRLADGEEERIFAGARAWDLERAVDATVEQLLASHPEVPEQYRSLSQKKRIEARLRKELRPVAQAQAQPGTMMQAFVAFQLMTAARRGETLGLTWAHVDLVKQTAFLPETKNGLARTLPLRAELVAMLDALPRHDERVFPMSVDKVRDAWAYILNHAHIEGLHIHDLRHEGISRVADTGQFNLVDLQAFSGHRDLRMLTRYAHLCASKMALRLDAAFATEGAHYTHKGRERLAEKANVTMAELVSNGDASTLSVNFIAATAMPTPPRSNVIAFPERRVRA